MDNGWILVKYVSNQRPLQGLKYNIFVAVLLNSAILLEHSKFLKVLIIL